MTFEFATAHRVLFGPGTFKQAGAIAKQLGTRALVVTGKSSARAEGLCAQLAALQVGFEMCAITGEPTTDAVRDGLELARKAGCGSVIAFGGGSAIDAAKAIAGLLTNGGALADYLEVIGRGAPLTRPAAPLLAIPTTAGTGAEVTRNAVLASPEHRLKASLRSPHLLPRVALVDPELTLNLPPELTASTGMDALTQLIESYVCVRANPLTDGVCVEGLRRAARSLRRAFERGDDAAAREDMALASLFGGMALANAGLGAVHGFAAPIGGMFPAPHGAVCAALLPGVMAANVRALRERMPEGAALRRYDEVARLLTGQPQATADDGVAWTRELCRALQIVPLRTWGVTEGDVSGVVEKALQASSMKANSIPLTALELGEVLRAAL
ncbi:MAG: iron-containing alcohol dehydrogenase [Verrucomicrobia bacterium]|nr:iron-containing alcohol dehydrogenase [Verrucomicrobiota bacterium]NBU11171.1 iron-containing alcohol dehydrogenase [Pseudomonadota bacterium]NDA67113.1 iron-containing alcohol dehydrogenase [Verrucomicrobiota bacterium]NDB76760.1 iron-containing alcohol dehydrogenase [Verrucomicrobiota bacterium]NDD38951.1 iron-containing alcohol dehydrogenase [Verrucomicrobiota bacterium]